MWGVEFGRILECNLQLPPPPSDSHHQDNSIFSRESQAKPSFVTVTGLGVDRKYIPLTFLPSGIS